MIKEYLNQPYPLFGGKWKIIVSISLFIAFFMLIFQPFGLSEYQGSNKGLIIAGYGFVTFIILIADLFVIQFFFKKRFDNNIWTVKKQIFWLFWIVFTIGLGNFLYSSLIFWWFGSLYGLLIVQFYTLAVGTIPIIVLTIVRQNLRLSQNLKIVKDFNSNLILKDNESEKQIVTLIADNDKDKLEITLSGIVYIESTGNYIEVFHVKDNRMTNSLLRCALKRAELQLQKHLILFKCHRAFIVNINKIIQVKGNSQGIRLVLKNTETEIPVSRNLSRSLKDTMKSYQQKM